MDEAHMLGRGTYYSKHGDSNRYELMCRHLERVSAICRRYQFTPMMWRFFRLGNGGEYYGQNAVSSEVVSRISSDVNLVYWDYYHDDSADYDRMLKLHRQISDRTVFAGGIWKWDGYLPYIRTSIDRTRTALEACTQNGICDVFTTAWGDDGADASLFSVLPALQAQAEFGFYEDVSEERLAQRLQTCTKAVLSDFMQMDMSDMASNGTKNRCMNFHKYMLFQDVLMGLFDQHVPEGTQAWYADFQSKMAVAAKADGPYQYLFQTAEALAGALVLKAELGIELKAAYDSKNMDWLKKASAERLPLLIEQVERFRDCLEIQWMIENKPFGFEVQDMRLGALLQRLKSAKNRLEAYVNGKLKRLDELEEERRPFIPEMSGKLLDVNQWARMVTASTL